VPKINQQTYRCPVRSATLGVHLTGDHTGYFQSRSSEGINIWNSLPMSVEFGSLSGFKKSLGDVNLNQFLTVYKFPRCVLMCIAFRLHFCFYCRRIFVSIVIGKSLFLARSDMSAGNSLSVPQLTAVRCRYPVLTSLPFLKQAVREAATICLRPLQVDL